MFRQGKLQIRSDKRILNLMADRLETSRRPGGTRSKLGVKNTFSNGGQNIKSGVLRKPDMGRKSVKGRRKSGLRP